MSTSISFILLFGISGGEIIVVLLLILILFGPKKIPEIARTIGKGMNEIKKVQRDINAEINRYSREIDNPAQQIKEDIEGFKKGLNDQVTQTFAEPDSTPTKSTVTDANLGTITPEVSESEELIYPYIQSSDKTDDPDDVTEKDSSPDKNLKK
jgi:sec-independent protein translocase protein TatA